MKTDESAKWWLNMVSENEGKNGFTLEGMMKNAVSELKMKRDTIFVFTEN